MAADCRNRGRRASFTEKIGLAFQGSFVINNFEDTDSEESDTIWRPSVHQPVFTDAEAMKEKIYANLFKEVYDVSKYYHKTGLWRELAMNPVFEKFTLGVIAVNAIWIGIDTDYNKAEMLMQADPIFQVVEYCFCVYFAFEWFTRFMSFRKKRWGLRDAWFSFDSLLVGMMVLETWALTAIMLVMGMDNSSGGLGNASILRMARLARLTRMGRLARLLRAMPELMILIKGLVSATRSVFFTLCLLCILLYIFAIAFSQLTAGTHVGEVFFDGVGPSMYTLLIYGTLMDNIGLPLSTLGNESMVYAAMYLLFVLLATVTVMNMLIGVLCEVVTTVAMVEKEEAAVGFVKHRLMRVLTEIDDNNSQSISREEFLSILANPEAIDTLSVVGIDVLAIIELADFVFTDEDDSQEMELSFTDFIKTILSFRGSNHATVKDIVDFHKFVKGKIDQSTQELRELKEALKAEEPRSPKTPKSRRKKSVSRANTSKSAGVSQVNTSKSVAGTNDQPTKGGSLSERSLAEAIEAAAEASEKGQGLRQTAMESGAEEFAEGLPDTLPEEEQELSGQPPQGLARRKPRPAPLTIAASPLQATHQAMRPLSQAESPRPDESVRDSGRCSSGAAAGTRGPRSAAAFGRPPELADPGDVPLSSAAGAFERSAEVAAISAELDLAGAPRLAVPMAIPAVAVRALPTPNCVAPAGVPPMPRFLLRS